MFFLHGVLVFLCFLHHGFSLQNGFSSDDELVSTVVFILGFGFILNCIKWLLL